MVTVMKHAEELRKLRQSRRWRLQDLARALGVTAATVSRVERGLQEPSPALLERWKQLLIGERWLPAAEIGPRRRPRGVLPALAEQFLTDVTAGLNEVDAGWRDPAQVGMTASDVKALGPEVETDTLGRVRISPKSSLEQVAHAQEILRYRATVEVELQTLLPLLEEHLPPLWQLLQAEESCGAVLLSGLTRMVRTAAPLLDARPSLLAGDAGQLICGAVGPASLILESVGIVAPTRPRDVLETAGLTDLIESSEDGQVAAQATILAHNLGIASIARLLGKTAIIGLGAAWAVVRRLDSRNVAILTEVGRQRVAEAFWEGIHLSRGEIERAEVEAAWRRLNEFDPETEQEQLGILLWSWPEVL